jgi:hypothetical protein
MHLHKLVDVQRFRVLLPFPFQSASLQSALVEQLPANATGWLSINELSEHFTPNFSHRNRLNLPGPFYGAETDTCATGPMEAPRNVLLDSDGCEFLFKQPSTAEEFRQVIRAAICECFQGYGADGNEHWRLSLIREWWRDRHNYIAETDISYCSAEAIAQWRSGLEGDAEPYLREYAFFVDNGRVPNDGELLPEVG